MFRRPSRPSEPVAEAPETTAAPGTQSGTSDPRTSAAVTPAAASALGSLADLPVAGLTRRRIALLLGALVVAWVVVLFARQVSEASAAGTRAEELRAANAALAQQVEDLEAELELIQRQEYIAQQARAFRLGGQREVAFSLQDGAPTLAPDAPGSASVRLGAAGAGDRTPLDAWLEVLFGPAS